MNRTQMQGDNASVSKGQKTAAPLMPAAINSPELEIKDAQLIFGAIWRELEEEFGRSRMRFPKELILLGGGAGRGQRHQLGLHPEGARYRRAAHRGFPAP
jgi:hypothetical protein